MGLEKLRHNTVDHKHDNWWLATYIIGMGETTRGIVSEHLCTFLEYMIYNYSYIVFVAKVGRMDKTHAITWNSFKMDI